MKNSIIVVFIFICIFTFSIWSAFAGTDTFTPWMEDAMITNSISPTKPISDRRIIIAATAATIEFNHKFVKALTNLFS